MLLARCLLSKLLCCGDCALFEPSMRSPCTTSAHESVRNPAHFTAHMLAVARVCERACAAQRVSVLRHTALARHIAIECDEVHNCSTYFSKRLCLSVRRAMLQEPRMSTHHQQAPCDQDQQQADSSISQPTATSPVPEDGILIEMGSNNDLCINATHLTVRSFLWCCKFHNVFKV